MSETLSRTCQNCKIDFTIESDDFVFYEKMKVPPPTFCPKCRQVRRLFLRNFRTLYRRPSSKSGKMIISMYNEDQPFPVWSTEEWYADGWDALEHGRDFDFSRPFFEQWKELSDVVPRFSLMVNNSPGCEYSNLCNRSSNCYFCFGCVDNEYCDYSHSVWNCRESLDCLYLFKSEYCYECVDVTESNKMFYSQECISCSDSIGLLNCRGCVDCIGCVGLRNKSYHIFNKQVTREEYKAFLEAHPLNDPASISYILEKRNELAKDFPHPYMYGTQNVDVVGNHIFHSKNIQFGFDIKSGEDSKYGYTVRKMVSSYDCNFCLDIENSYECLFSQPYGLRFCHLAIDCTNSDYVQFCLNSNNLFGCIGLRKKDYCILNKQYTKEEYQLLVPKIIEHMKITGEWGEFFPIELAPYAYNESTVGEYYPLTKEDAVSKGFKWRDDLQKTEGQENSSVKEMNIDPYNWSIIKDKIFACESCKRNYRMTDHEISFYQRLKLALPVNCFFCRHQKRMDMRLPRELYDRTCMCEKQNHTHDGKCEILFKTAYKPDRPEKIFCESCYNQEIA
jgi:hypothetical protein